MSSGTPDITLVAFAVLEPFLPSGTMLTSSYRAPADQLLVIRSLMKRAKIRETGPMLVDDPNTWLPPLKTLRAKGYKVNAPSEGYGIPVSPHTQAKVVFDMSGSDLHQIEKGCKKAQSMGVMGFKQILLESKNNAVHVEVKWISSRALRNLYEDWGFAYA